MKMKSRPLNNEESQKLDTSFSIAHLHSYSPPPSPVMTNCWLRHKLPITVKCCLLSVMYSLSSFPCCFFLLHWLTMQMYLIFCTSSSLNFGQTMTAVFCGFSQSMVILLYIGSNSLFVACITKQLQKILHKVIMQAHDLCHSIFMFSTFKF
jgi:hypothetical protein